METYSLWLEKKNKPVIKKNKITYKSNNKTVLIKTLYSGVSKGTEKLVTEGKVDKDQYQLMQAPFQDGSFAFPIKYGYINIGQIIDGPKKYINKKTFCLFPHQSIFEMELNKLTILKNQNIKKYLLTANMETAINIFWDAQAKKDEKIIIVGMGSIGILTAYYFQLQKYKNVYVSDNNKHKLKYSKLLNLKFINFEKVKNADVIINTTSNYDILKRSFKLLNLDGKFIEASWYGNKQTNISLGGYFHSKRLKIISSQVSNIPKLMKKSYDYKKRLKIAIRALSNNHLIKLINNECDFEDIKKKYISILNDPNTIMHAIKYK